MVLIYQIGRIERNILEKLNFKCDEKIYSSYMSSFALRESFRASGVDARVVLLYPVSLPVRSQPSLQVLPDSEFKNFLLEINRTEENLENYLFSPKDLFKHHPHNKEADDFIVIHSQGEHGKKYFDTTLQDLILEIFIDMLERYRLNPFSELYLDISSGLNFFITALIEAGRLFLTFYKLQNFENYGKGLDVYITFSDPITGSDRVYALHSSFKLDLRVFFSYPKKPEKNNLNEAYIELLSYVRHSDKALYKTLREVLVRGYIYYWALSRNTPLVLYTEDFTGTHTPEDVNSACQALIDYLKKKFEENYEKSPGLDFDKVRDTFLMLSLFKGILKLKESFDIKPKDEVSVRELQSKFASEEENIYSYLGLPTHRAYLSHELRENFLDSKKAEGVRSRADENFRLLTDLIDDAIRKETDKYNWRNFVAHCGFERNCVEVRKVGEEIFIRYTQSEDTRDKILRDILAR